MYGQFLSLMFTALLAFRFPNVVIFEGSKTTAFLKIELVISYIVIHYDCIDIKK